MNMATNDLVGVWQLVSFLDLDDAGTTGEGPLGPEPSGLLFYTRDGHVSVHMMRTGASAGGDGAEPAPQTYLSYAGTWRRIGEQVVHTITVAPDTQWLDTEQVRHLTLNADHLTLVGTTLSGPVRRRVLTWRRTGTGTADLTAAVTS